MIQLILLTVLVVLFFTVLIYSANTLKTNFGSDIRIVWYFFSLSFVITSLIALWAIGKGAIDNSGKFKGEIGEFLNNLMLGMLDINLSLYLILTIVIVILLPQIISYLLSGLSGTASKPVLIEESLSFVVWGLVKTFVVASGIIFSISIIGYFNNWSSFSISGLYAFLSLSLMFISLSFVSLLFFRETESVLNDFKQYCPTIIYTSLLKTHSWLTRNED